MPETRPSSPRDVRAEGIGKPEAPRSRAMPVRISRPGRWGTNAFPRQKGISDEPPVVADADRQRLAPPPEENPGRPPAAGNGRGNGNVGDIPPEPPGQALFQRLSGRRRFRDEAVPAPPSVLTRDPPNQALPRSCGEQGRQGVDKPPVPEDPDRHRACRRFDAAFEKVGHPRPLALPQSFGPAGEKDHGKTPGLEGQGRGIGLEDFERRFLRSPPEPGRRRVGDQGRAGPLFPVQDAIKKSWVPCFPTVEWIAQVDNVVANAQSTAPPSPPAAG